MTTMDSDSESQDSDDGRRFRFEATRKDSVAPVDTTDRTNTSKKKHKSLHSENYRDRKERSKHESGSKTDDKDFRHSTKHSKHELRNSRQEDSKNLHKDHRESRSGFATNDRGSRNSNVGERSRDSKRQSDKDRNIHRVQRLQEHSYERNQHDERASSDKHRSRYHERHKHRSRDRSRDRSHQSSRVKSSNDDHRSREDHGRHDSSRKISVKENRSQNSRDYSSPKNTEQERSHSETRSSENTKKDSSIEAQDCKDLDLSQFDVLSETDENMSDGQDSIQSRTSSSHTRKIKLKRHDFEIRSESRAKRENNDEASKTKRQEELKVKRGSYDPASSSSNNNPSAVSDSLFNSASYATLLVTKETCMDSEREKSEYREEDKMLICDSNVECSNSGEKYSRSSVSSDETRLFEKNIDQAGSTYGPPLPPGFAPNASDGDKLDSETNILDENKINDEVDGKNMNFIGPRLLPRLKDRRSIEQEEAEDAVTSAAEADAVFGPALPPHLLQRQRKNDSQDKIIGPVLPSILESREGLIVSPESDDDSTIGPLPVDHPALRTSRIHEQLDLRAQRIRNEKYSEEVDVGNKREEWMTELPPAQAANLGLGPRKFRLRDGPDMSDRSCWTDTPTQKAQKQMDLETKRFRESEKKPVNEFHKKEVHRKEDKSRKHEKSLLEMHQSKIAKKKKKEEKEARRTGISTRRPFDRDIDLQVNRFDQAQKKTILMKAQLLDDRFSRGQI